MNNHPQGTNLPEYSEWCGELKGEADWLWLVVVAEKQNIKLKI